MTDKTCNNSKNNYYYYNTSTCSSSSTTESSKSKCDESTSSKSKCNDTSTSDCNTECETSKTCVTESRTTDTETSKTCDSSSTSKTEKVSCESCKCEKESCKCVSTKNTCKELSKKYKKYKDCITSNNEALCVLEFIQQKMKDALPIIVSRNMSNYTIRDNIDFIEKFFDGVLCVASSNTICKKIKVKTCKVKNNCEKLENRVYEMNINFEKCVASKNFTYVFPWSRLTNNTDFSFNACVVAVIGQVTADIVQLKAQNTGVFF